jgi:hypothetical protein
MQASDMILGLLIVVILGWTLMLAVQFAGLNAGLQALEAKQVAQGIQISPEKCGEVWGKTLVLATEIEEKEYFTTVGFDSERKQVYFCFYE